jgi:hypothetical protein
MVLMILLVILAIQSLLAGHLCFSNSVAVISFVQHFIAQPTAWMSCQSSQDDDALDRAGESLEALSKDARSSNKALTGLVVLFLVCRVSAVKCRRHCLRKLSQ